MAGVSWGETWGFTMEALKFWSSVVETVCQSLTFHLRGRKIPVIDTGRPQFLIKMNF